MYKFVNAAIRNGICDNDTVDPVQGLLQLINSKSSMLAGFLYFSDSSVDSSVM